MRFAPYLSRFRSDRQGLAGIEFALLAPVMIALLLGAVTVALAYRDSKTADRAASVIGDVISRETTVDGTYLQNCYKLFQNLTGRNADAIRFRVSSIKKTSGAFKIDWSYAVAPAKAMTASELAKQTFPLLSDNDSLIVVETTVLANPFSSFVSIVFPDTSSFVSERPRFTAAIVKTDG